jgi:hypothetical protein
MSPIIFSIARAIKTWLGQGNEEALLETFLITVFLTLALISGMAILSLE